jgi:hypothetical protein
MNVMSDTAPSQPAGKFTPEQCEYLGKVYATILRWSREDDARLQEQKTGTAAASFTSQDTAALIATVGQA